MSAAFKMPLQAVVDFKLACSCLYLWIWIFTIFLLAVEVTNLFVMSLLIAGPIVTYWLITTFAIPTPHESIVQEILGSELKGDILCESSSSSGDVVSCPDEPTDFAMKVIAHRFAGIEAPENSLEALELVSGNFAYAL